VINGSIRACIIVSLLALGRANAFDPPDSAGVAAAIGRGVGFLQRSQMSHGEFRTYASTDSTLRRLLHFDSSPFVTSFVVYSLGYVDDPRVPEMAQRATRFLRDEMDRNGTWRYWTSLNDKRIDPDLDDTACISFLLRQRRVPFSLNTAAFYGNLDRQGRFKTWLRAPGSSAPNDVDCVVNANVLLYLGSNSRTKAACDFINDVVMRDRWRASTIYYVHETALYYMVSRAYHHGVTCLAASRASITTRTQRLQGDGGSFGDALATGFGVCALLSFDAAPDSALQEAVRFLMSQQRSDGSWPICTFYAARDDGVWWGSEELTTALCLEALARYGQAAWGSGG